MQHRLRRFTGQYRHALPGCQGSRLHRYCQCGDPGRERLGLSPCHWRQQADRKLCGGPFPGVRFLPGALPLQGPRYGGLRRRHQKHLHRLGFQRGKMLDPLRRNQPHQPLGRGAGSLSGVDGGGRKVGGGGAGREHRLCQCDEPPFGGLRLQRQPPPNRICTTSASWPLPTRWLWTRPASTLCMPRRTGTGLLWWSASSPATACTPWNTVRPSAWAAGNTGW